MPEGKVLVLEAPRDEIDLRASGETELPACLLLTNELTSGRS